MVFSLKYFASTWIITQRHKEGDFKLIAFYSELFGIISFVTGGENCIIIITICTPPSPRLVFYHQPTHLCYSVHIGLCCLAVFVRQPNVRPAFPGNNHKYMSRIWLVMTSKICFFVTGLQWQKMIKIEYVCCDLAEETDAWTFIAEKRSVNYGWLLLLQIFIWSHRIQGNSCLRWILNETAYMHSKDSL